MWLRCLLLVLFCSHWAFAQSSAPVGGTPSAEAAAVDTAYIWRQAVGGTVLGRPTVQAHSVVVVLDGGKVRAYSASGRYLWEYLTPGRLTPYVTRSREGTSYICRTNGIFIAVNRIGRELWRTNIGEAIAGPPVLGWDGRVFIPIAKKIFCYTASGNPLWTAELDAKISAGPWLDQDGGLLLALENGDALRINHFGTAAVVHLPSVPRMLLSVNTAAAGPSKILALYPTGAMQLITLPAVSPKDTPVQASGGRATNSSLAVTAFVDLPRLPSAPLAAASRGGKAAAALSNGQLVMISAADGKILWSADTRISVQDPAAVVYDERGIYVLSTNGAAGFTAEGSRLWFSILKNSSGLPAFDDEGVLYSGGKDWILYAWKLEEKELKQRRNLYGPAPEGSYRTGVAPPSTFGAGDGRFEEAQVRRELEIINKGIKDGRVGEKEREWLAYLMDVAGSDFRPGAYLSNRSRASIIHRIMALQLMSRIGSCETIPWLTRLFKAETEPLVKAAIARAIGGIGVDPDGIAIGEFLNVAITSNPVRNEQVLVSVAASTGALCRFSGPPLFDVGSRVLILLSGTDQRSSVQKQALKELKNLTAVP